MFKRTTSWRCVLAVVYLTALCGRRSATVGRAMMAGLTSDEHFSVDGTLIESHASIKQCLKQPAMSSAVTAARAVRRAILVMAGIE